MHAAVSLSNKNLPQAIKEAATTKVVECLDKMTDFERQEIFQQKSNWDLLFDEVFSNMLQYKDCRDVVLKRTIDEILCRLYVDNDCPKLKVTLSCYGELRQFELWDIWDRVDDKYKRYDYLVYLNRCNSLILEFLERLEGTFSCFESDCFSFYGEDKDKWQPIKTFWRKHENVSQQIANTNELQEVCIQKKYREDLLKLFHDNILLIEELVGKSDDEIASRIRQWAKEKDKVGRTLIENPRNRLKATFARELKNAGIINLSERTFRDKL